MATPRKPRIVGPVKFGRRNGVENFDREKFHHRMLSTFFVVTTLADSMMVSRRLIRYWINGKYKPSLNNLKIAAQQMGTSYREFLKEIPPHRRFAGSRRG